MNEMEYNFKEYKNSGKKFNQFNNYKKKKKIKSNRYSTNLFKIQFLEILLIIDKTLKDCVDKDKFYLNINSYYLLKVCNN